MHKFKATNLESLGIKSETELADAKERTKIVKMDKSVKTTVRSYDVPSITGSDRGNYTAVKSRYGALAITDTDRIARDQKDSRFRLASLARGPLSVEAEERRYIEDLVTQRVQSVIEETKKKAFEEGYQAGQKLGHAEAFQKFQKEGAARLEQFMTFLQATEQAKVEVFEANERFLLELIYRISKMVILKELTTDKEYLLRLTKELVERVGVKENVTIQISREDADTLSMLKEGLFTSLGSLKNVNIEISNQVKQGGCTVETEWNAIDASVEMQLNGIYDALFGREASGAA